MGDASNINLENFGKTLRNLVLLINIEEKLASSSSLLSPPLQILADTCIYALDKEECLMMIHNEVYHWNSSHFSWLFFSLPQNFLL